MELIAVNNKPSEIETSIEQVINESTNENFLVANTQPVTSMELKDKCIIPSFAKDNESTISHTEFIDVIGEMASDYFKSEIIYSPAIRVSHPISGRIPEAMGKPAKDLFEHEKTLYYERMAFIIEIPSIKANIHGNDISLTIGGVRSYNLENLHSRKSEERFKLFIGFQNKVCTNLCISTDGFMSDLKVRTTAELANNAYELFSNYAYEKKVSVFSSLGNLAISEHQFAQIIGKMKLYQYLPLVEKRDLEQVPMNDSQVSAIARDFYSSNSFSRNDDGDIDLWKLYNLFTSANKSSYIDTFLDRGAGCLIFAEMLQNALRNQEDCWFLQ
jgi:hypothetical protein